MTQFWWMIKLWWWGIKEIKIIRVSPKECIYEDKWHKLIHIKNK
jgi:hypothetical protein